MPARRSLARAGTGRLGLAAASAPPPCSVASSGQPFFFLHSSAACSPSRKQCAWQSSGRSPGLTGGQLFAFLQESATLFPKSSQKALHSFSLLIWQERDGTTLLSGVAEGNPRARNPADFRSSAVITVHLAS